MEDTLTLPSQLSDMDGSWSVAEIGHGMEEGIRCLIYSDHCRGEGVMVYSLVRTP